MRETDTAPRLEHLKVHILHMSTFSIEIITYISFTWKRFR